jgi:hypothetical protein
MIYLAYSEDRETWAGSAAITLVTPISHLPAESAPQVEEDEPNLPAWYVELRAHW